ncbi:MAG: accessory gene regulator ArgB-like protein [Butyrivibrio sp.]
MNKMLDRIVDRLSDSGYVTGENYEIVRYGLELFIMKTLISIAMLIIAFITGSVLEVLAFMCAYQPLRSTCGGYHARTRTACFISSLLMSGTVILMGKVLPAPAFICVSFSLLFIGVVIILILSPVDTPTKPFDDIERIVFRKRSLIITIILVIIFMAFSLLGFRKIQLSVSLAVIYTALLLIPGKLGR